MDLSKYEVTKPHNDEMLPYGYRFSAIDLIKLDDWNQEMGLIDEMRETHKCHTIQLGTKNPHAARIIWEVASHIEGNFGLPYEAILVYAEAHGGTLYIFTPEKHDWWKDSIRRSLSNYLMGLRSLLDLLK